MRRARAIVLAGRDFAGFQGGIAAAAARWGGELDARWTGLEELERIADRGDADVLLMPADWIAPLAAAGAIRPLDGLLASGAPEGWPHGWSPTFHEGVRWDDRVWGVPFHDGPQLLIHRRDLYEDPRERAGYRARLGAPLRPPRTWAEFDAQARWFTRPAEGRWGTVLAGLPDGHNNVYDFVVQLRRFGGDVLADPQPGARPAPGFGGEAGLRALAWLRALRLEAVDPRAHEWDSVASGERFAAGEVAVMANWAGYAQAADAAGPVAGLVGWALLPDDAERPTVSVNAFWVLALAARDGAEAGWGLVRTAVSEQGDRETTLAGASGARVSTWRDPRAGGGVAALFERAHARSRPLPALPAAARLVTAVSGLVDDVVWGEADAASRLVEAEAEARAILSGGEGR